MARLPESEPKKLGYRSWVAAHIAQSVADRAILKSEKDFTALTKLDLVRAIGISRRYLQPAIDAASLERKLKVQTYIPVQNHGGYHETSGRLRVRVIEDHGHSVPVPIEDIAEEMAAEGLFVEDLYPPSNKLLPQSSTELPDRYMAIHY